LAVADSDVAGASDAGDALAVLAVLGLEWLVSGLVSVLYKDCVP
jgi:hypothetical protein